MIADALQQGVPGIKTGCRAAEDRSKVKPEAVHTHCPVPVDQAVEYQVLDLRVILPQYMPHVPI